MALRLPPNLSDAQSDDASVVSVASSASILSEIVAGVLTAKSTRKKHRHSDRHRHLVKSSANESQEIMTSLNYKSASSLLGKGSMLAEDSTDGIEGTLNRSKETPIKESSMIDEILEITDWDTETQRLLKLFLPYALQAAAEGIFGIIDFALIGYFLGVQAANVWIVVGILMEFTQTLTYGFSEGEF